MTIDTLKLKSSLIEKGMLLHRYDSMRGGRERERERGKEGRERGRERGRGREREGERERERKEKVINKQKENVVTINKDLFLFTNAIM